VSFVDFDIRRHRLLCRSCSARARVARPYLRGDPI